MRSPSTFLPQLFSKALRKWHWLPIGLVVLINVKLHTGPDLRDPGSVQASVLDQMRYLEPQMHLHGLGKRMQGIFPEGFVFAHVLYGLTWCELAQQAGVEVDDTLYTKALAEARWAFQQIDSEAGKATFDRDMEPSHGMFYQGWRNYLLAKIVQASKGKDKAEVAKFGTLSRALASAFRASSSPFLDSYPDQSWPADACVGMASLGLYGQLVGPEFEALRQQWVAQVKPLSEELQGLPHKTASGSTKVEDPHRGCSAALNLYFLPDIDLALGRREYTHFAAFACTRLGLATTREYADRRLGGGDIDSGPVIWGVGFSATIVSIGAHMRWGNYEMAQDISDAVEALGFSHNLGGKRYILGSLPIADLFIAWARIQPPLQHREGEGNVIGGNGSKPLFHGVSLLLVLLIWGLRHWSRINPITRLRGMVNRTAATGTTRS